MTNFGMRNLIIFFRDRSTVVLSFLAEYIIIGLYVLFIRDNLLNHFSQITDAPLLLDSWMIAGILAITSVTTTMGAYGVMVEDHEKNVFQDFQISPVNRFYFLGGYLFCAVLIGLITTTMTLILSEIYILVKYDTALLSGRFLKCYGLILLTTFSNSCLVLFCVSFLKSNTALASCCTIIGALIGFLTGIYLPMGNLPDFVQEMVKAFPISHGVVLFRQLIMDPLIADSFAGQQTAADSFCEFMGVRYYYGEKELLAGGSVLVLTASAILFLLLSVWVFYHKRIK